MIYKERLKSLRERIGLSQRELGNLINVCSDAYGQYENEKFIIAIKHLNTICNYFNVSIDYIFGFNTKKNYKDNRKEINKKLSGERLKALRKENKLTQKALADILHISRTTITEYERGTNIIATLILYLLCKKYKISADYLLGKNDNKNIK